MKLDFQAQILYTDLEGKDSDFTSGMIGSYWKVLKDLLWLFCSEEKILINNSRKATEVNVKSERHLVRSVWRLDSHFKAAIIEL